MERQAYHLFFGTNNHRGYEKMKEAMWAVDPAGGTRFADSTAPGQSIMFSDTTDLHILERALRRSYAANQWHRYDELERFTWDETAYLPRHLKEDLERLRRLKSIQVLNLGPRGGYRADTLVNFLP